MTNGKWRKYASATHKNSFSELNVKGIFYVIFSSKYVTSASYSKFSML